MATNVCDVNGVVRHIADAIQLNLIQPLLQHDEQSIRKPVAQDMFVVRACEPSRSTNEVVGTECINAHTHGSQRFLLIARKPFGTAIWVDTYEHKDESVVILSNGALVVHSFSSVAVLTLDVVRARKRRVGRYVVQHL